jgi:radical SAM protein with 4Fe4S-binding SPASM domain
MEKPRKLRKINKNEQVEIHQLSKECMDCTYIQFCYAKGRCTFYIKDEEKHIDINKNEVNENQLF